MKMLTKTLTPILTTMLTTALAFAFNACSKDSPFHPEEREQSVSTALAKGSSYPQYAESTFKFQANLGAYQGGTVNVPGGSTFFVAQGALIPPAGTPIGDPVTLTMNVEKKKVKGNDILEFTFGPHGSQFVPPAEVTFDWNDLGVEVANLYYIDDNGKFVPQTPNDIDINNHRMTLKIHHFSRYAMGGE